MALEDLNEKLYGRDIHLGRAEKQNAFDPKQGIADPSVTAQFQKQETWQAPVAKQPPAAEPGIRFADLTTLKRRKRIALFLGGLALIVLLGGAVMKIRGMLFAEDRVSVSISGPKDVASVEETTFVVTYTNDNLAGLDDASLILTYPAAFHLEAENTMRVSGSLAEISLGTIAAHAQGKVSVKGKFYGSRGDHLTLQATLRYSPSKVSTVLEKTTPFAVTVASSPLFLEMTAPLELATGQSAVYVIDYSNKSDMAFSNVRVKAVYPEGFRFVSADPKPSEGETVWYVGNLDINARGKITIQGILTGTRDEYKRVGGMIGFFQGDGKFVAYADNERQTRIVASPLSISQTVNSLTDIAVSPGDMLQYVIHYKNDGNIGLRDAIITVEIDPTFLDVSRFVLQKGAYDVARKVIVWKASDIPGLGKLEPGAEGEVTFSVPVMEKIAAGSGKNLSISTVAKIDSLDIQTPSGANKIIASNTLSVKLKSAVGIGTAALYTDAIFPNSGPIPPKVGQTTSYTVHLNVTNSLNDLKDARISVILPTGVHYSGKHAPGGETLTFNERSNELVWELGTFAATEGKARELVFQVSVIPSPDQVNKTLTLIKNIVFIAKDAFTNQDVRTEGEKQENILKNDAVYGASEGASMVQAAE
ncbi:MAG: hypothetical protein WAV46_00280 [Candidatus Moraniibacteriota bacterium]